MSADLVFGNQEGLNMFESGWFWIFVAFFFIWGPMRWKRRNHWAKWDPMGWEAGTKDREKQRREDAEQRARRDEQVEQLEARVNELESRLDFAERLLASRREDAIMPPRT